MSSYWTYLLHPSFIELVNLKGDVQEPTLLFKREGYVSPVVYM